MYDYLDPANIMKGPDVDENLKMVVSALKVMQFYLDTFNVYRTKVRSYQTWDVRPRSWDFSKGLVFGRFEEIMDRLKKLKVITVDTYE